MFRGIYYAAVALGLHCKLTGFINLGFHNFQLRNVFVRCKMYIIRLEIYMANIGVQCFVLLVLEFVFIQ